MVRQMKTNSKLRKGITVAAYVLVGIFAVFIAFVLYSNLTGKTLFIGGKTAMWVKTGSMEPEIPARSYILIERADTENIKVGDVIVFYSDDPSIYGKLNAHRVTEIIDGGKRFATKGDNNPGPDKYYARADKVIGVYRKNLKLLSYLGRFFLTPLGITITIIFVLAMVVPIYLPDILSAINNKKKQEITDKKQAKIDELVRAEVEKLMQENNDKGIENKEE